MAMAFRFFERLGAHFAQHDFTTQGRLERAGDLQAAFAFNPVDF